MSARRVGMEWWPMPRLTVALAALALLGLVACGGGEQAGGDGEQVTLTIGGWGGAINEATQAYYLDPYTAETGVQFRFVDAPGTQLAAVEAQQEAGNVEWDLLDSVAGDAAFALDDKGYLEPLPEDLRGQLEEILGQEKVTPFGFSHANVGHVIACNMDVMDECPKNMAEFFDTERFPQDRMIGGIAPIMQITMAQVATGTPPSETSTTEVDLDAAMAALEELKPFVRVFYESGDQQLQVMRSGEVDMAVMWSGRAYQLIAEGMNLEIHWDGGVYEPSYWAVVKGAPHTREAFDFLLALARNAEGQAQWANGLHYSVPNPEAFEFIDESVVPELADTPENFSQLAIPNFEWYVQHLDEVNSAFQEYLRG